MLAKINVNPFKVWKQMRLKIGENLKQSSLNSKFTGSIRKEYFGLFTFEKR